jgi:hypothetical protein
MDNLQIKIRETLLNAPSGVHGIIYGPKIKNNEIVNTDSLIYFVENKIPLSAIPLDERIPQRLNIDGIDYLTDVVQSNRFTLNQCYNLTDPSIRALQSRTRPLSGGLEISALNSWTQVSPFNFTLGTGTLGFLAIDNTDGKLVGVTNNHVIVQDAFVNHEKIEGLPASSIVDPVQFSMQGGYNATLPNIILQFGTFGGSVDFSNDYIGYPKRYVPISQFGTNTVDGALLSIKSDVFTSNSSSQAQLLNTYAMPFATTTDVESLSTNAHPIYSVGRTTGAKGTNCPLVVYGNGTALIPFLKQQQEVEVLFSNCLFYRFADFSNLPVYRGDSGSALIANINGTNKIAGLVYAGNTNKDPLNPTSTIGVACRIDDVADQLNISAWDGSPIGTSQDLPNFLYMIRPKGDTRTSIVSGGRIFYQAGTGMTTLPDTQI